MRIASRWEHDGGSALRARLTDDPSWDAMVARFTPMLLSIARTTGLGPADAADVCQTSWLRLVQHFDTLENPERVGAWLATTSRREAIRVSQRRRRDVLTEGNDVFDDRCPPVEGPSEPRNAGTRELADTLATLPARSQALVTMLLADPPRPYADISSTLDIPIGSIGPTRARILHRLRTTLEDRGIVGVDLLDVSVG